MAILQRFAVIALVFIGLIVVGCASGVPPTDTMTRAELAIKSAEESNATISAPLQLRLAQDKLEAARAAVAKEEYEKAKDLAEEALVDAKLAEAMTRSEKAGKTTEEMRKSIETLRQEIERENKQ